MISRWFVSKNLLYKSLTLKESGSQWFFDSGFQLLDSGFFISGAGNPDFQVAGFGILVGNHFLYDGDSSHSTSTIIPPHHPLIYTVVLRASAVRAREKSRAYILHINLSRAAPAILAGFPVALNLPQKCISTGRRDQSLSGLRHFRCLFLCLAALSTCTRRWKAFLAPVYT